LDVRVEQQTSERVVELQSVEKVFSNDMRALAPVHITVRPGEFVSLIGPSGCGKSTLLKLIANLQDPTDGKILWWGGDNGQIGTPGHKLAFVFQDPTLMPWARVGSNVRLPLDLEGVKKTESNARVAAALATMNLSNFIRSYPRQLSGGMRMRVSIARAMVTEPNLLLMDEPFGALDEFTRNRLDLDLVRLSWERRLTTIFVTHSIYEAVFLSTRVLVMASRPGRIFGELLIDEPQPRTEDFRDTFKFSGFCRQLSEMLRKASIASGMEP
jgi:NitT/TauT family transport system ATP-binding protein